MSYRVIIPARYHSQRLPAKVLRDLGGKTLLQHVYEKAQQTDASQIIIATDHQDIADVANNIGAMCCMTRSDHATGSDRLAEVVQQLQLADDDIIVNVQADEVFIPPENIAAVAALLEAHPDAAVATLYDDIEHYDELMDPNLVKVVFNQQGYALYFSRAPISYERDRPSESTTNALRYPHYRHIGMYAYRTSALVRYVSLAPSPLEQAEKLEQLRFLWHGDAIIMAKAPCVAPPGIDTEADLQRAKVFL